MLIGNKFNLSCIGIFLVSVIMPPLPGGRVAKEYWMFILFNVLLFLRGLFCSFPFD